MNMADTITMYAEIQARDFSQGKRKKLAKSGAALPDGSFPIVNKHDLKNAEMAIGRAKNPGKARAHIRKRAKELHVKLSDTWKASGKKKKMHGDQIGMPGGARSDMGEARSLMPA